MEVLRCLEAEFQYFEVAMVVTSSEAKKNLCFWPPIHRTEVTNLRRCLRLSGHDVGGRQCAASLAGAEVQLPRFDLLCPPSATARIGEVRGQVKVES